MLNGTPLNEVALHGTLRDTVARVATCLETRRGYANGG
jgi:hypothetical protein